ncbi:keratin-associated protein 29-1 [Microtus ochrogaster]|uniref:Keratin-associated protein 29-1 n=1 Tax=Microtus ochrogaster TaxID=79684 RepID=A0ABM1AWG3_MICOH|nr:keratin-associated protein 29-1 [Microtus ochrogaster]
MTDSHSPGNPETVSSVPIISTCSIAGSIRNAIRLPSSCQSRTWQLVTHQENCELPNSAPVISAPVSCPSTCFPETSCVGFVCQPIGSPTACCAPNTGGTPLPAAPCQPSCLESAGCHTSCGDNSPCQQSSGRRLACTPGSCQTACDTSAYYDDGSCQPPCSEATPCAETPCLPASCEAGSCQPTCCQGGSHHPIKGECQLCKSVYYQPICYLLESCQSAPCMPLSCQPLTCMLSSCCQTCCMSSCQPHPCPPAPSVAFICQPVVTCQSPCCVKSNSKSASCAGRPFCGGPTSHQSGCPSPSCLPPCCVTGLGKPSCSGPGCCPPTSPNVCQGGTSVSTS